MQNNVIIMYFYEYANVEHTLYDIVNVISVSVTATLCM